MKQNRLSVVLIALFLIALLGSGLFYIFHSIVLEGDPLLPERCVVINQCEWETANGHSGSVDLPATLSVDGYEPVTYRFTLPEDLKDNEWLCLLIKSTFDIKINGQLRMTFDEYSAGIPGSIEKSAYIFCELNSEDAGALVEITLKNTNTSNGFLRPILLGDGYSILYHILNKNVVRYLGIICLFMIALIAVIVGIILSFQRKTPVNIIYIGTGLLLVCAWLILDDDLYPIFFSKSHIDGITSYLIAVLAPFPFMLYVDRLQQGRYHKLFTGLEIFNLIYFAIVCIIRFVCQISLVKYLLLYNLPIVLMCVIMLYPIIRDIITKQTGNYKHIVYGLISFAIFTALDIILINTTFDRTDGNLVLLGLYILSVTAFFQQINDSRKLYQTLDSQSHQIDVISELNRDLSIKAQTDPLTGLYNSTYLKAAVKKVTSAKQSGAFLLFDLDHFKNINDNYGHFEGDRVLIAFARSLKNSFRHEDIVCRLGGDEFVVFMTAPVTESLVRHKSVLIMDYFRSDPEMLPYHNLVDCSMGAAFIPKDGSDFVSLYQKADLEMYTEKEIHHQR